jgi:NAD kinase/nicotinic acid mononucleotide adenylyltransferase
MQIALYGGSFNPPGRHHVEVARALSGRFDRVQVLPCGPRPDKRDHDGVGPVFRAAMADIAFRGLPGVEVDLSDLEGAVFTRNVDWEARFPGHECWHVVGADLVLGGARGQSPIQTTWSHGARLWRDARFLVYHPPGAPPSPADLPPTARLLEVPTQGRSLEIRRRLFEGEPAGALIPDEVAGYIERHGLYRLREPARTTRVSLGQPRLLLCWDEMNPTATAWAARFARWEDRDDPTCVLVIGGDGTMLRAIHEHWRRRLPFFGVNAGHLGFLLNDAQSVLAAPFPPPEVIVRELPLLHVTTTLASGESRTDLSFNDAWVERLGGQSAWLEVAVDGKVRFDRLVCDGALASTAAGSTAYAASMGATPLLADTPAWLLVGSNVMSPRGWTSALLSMHSEVALRNLSPQKRPLRGYASGTPLGELLELRVRPARAASVALAWLPEHDMAEKIAGLHFPVAGR